MKIKIKSIRAVQTLIVGLFLCTILKLSAKNLVSNNNIIGYWKAEIIKKDNQVSRVLYVAILENGLAKSVAIIPTLNISVYKYSYEGNNYYTRRLSESNYTAKWIINWVNQDAFTLYFMNSNGVSNDIRHYYSRLTPEEYNQKTSLTPPMLSASSLIKPQNAIIGYWKMNKTININSPVSSTTYYKFSSDGSIESVFLYLDKCHSKKLKYWFEGDKYHTQGNGQTVRVTTLHWLSNDEFCIDKDDSPLHIRISQHEYQKAMDYAHNCPHSSMPLSQNPITTEKDSRIGFRCLICLDTGKVSCRSCGGKGKIKYVFRDDWFDCSMCDYGRAKCTAFRCPNN